LVNKYGSYEWTVEQVKNVCSIMFIKCYDITKSCLEELCKEVKGGIISNSREFSDRTSVGKDTARQTPAFAEQFNITLNNTQVCKCILRFILILLSYLRKLLLFCQILFLQRPCIVG
jgi:hypothetical protein